jgi:hypothetical protein
MINYITKKNEKYKNNVMKKKFKVFFFTLKKIKCSFNFLRWSIKWSLANHDGNHLMATKYQVSKQIKSFFKNNFLRDLVATKSFNSRL